MMLVKFFFKRTYRTNVNTNQWNKTIRTHQINGNYRQALKLFQIGIEKNTFQPNSVTYLTMLDICKQLKSLPTVRTIHNLIDSTKTNDQEIFHDPRLRSLLMDVYIKCQDIDSAYRVFQSMTERNVIDYCGLLTGFNQQGKYEKTLELAKQIPSSMKYSSPILCVLILQACTELKLYNEGCKIHQYGKDFLPHNKVFMNELMNFYLKFHQEKQALDIFENYPTHQTIIDYSLLMKYYNRQYQPNKTIDLYFRLKTKTQIPMDHIIYVLVLQALANGCYLHTSEQICRDVKKFGMNIDVENALINMYGKLGDLDQAEKVFHSMSKQNIVSYNILFNLYGLYHQSDKALKMFHQMCQQGHRPDDKTYVLLLHVLSKSPSKIKDTKRIFSTIEETKRGPMLISAMIAALIRAELFDEVNELLKKLPKENILFYAIKANLTDETKDKFTLPISITNEELALYDLLMSNIYTYAGVHDRLTIIDEILYDNSKLKAELSLCWFEKRNGQIEYFKSEHAEKLALTNALKEYDDNLQTILIGKNHRISTECHEYFQKVSRSSPQRKISLRDSTRFHIFSSGVCSCQISS
ncbi:hypothetical protein I4U23_026644 [Adineta vaga]|nr:hypothetical protein I4U23_026644 [Adineta vaga]